MKAVYKPGTTKSTIMLDGWSRNFEPKQILDEVMAQGFNCDLAEVTRAQSLYSMRYTAGLCLETGM